MKRFGILLSIAFLALPLAAQQANITAPVARTAETRIMVVDISMRRDCACANVIIEYQDAGAVPTRQVRYDIPADPANPGTEILTFLNALMTVRATETGGAGRRFNFRALGYLFDAGRLPGVALVP